MTRDDKGIHSNEYVVFFQCCFNLNSLIAYDVKHFFRMDKGMKNIWEAERKISLFG